MSNLHEPKAMSRERLPFGRLLAVDLRSLSDEQMSALSREAMKRGTSMPELLGQLVDEVSAKILNPEGRPA